MLFQNKIELCFYQVIGTHMKNEKYCGNTHSWQVFSQLFWVLLNFHECFINSTKSWRTFFLIFGNNLFPLPYNNTTFLDDPAQDEAFNGFFKSVYKDHSRCEVTRDKPVITDNRLCHVQVSLEEISKILSSLDVHKLIGPDKLLTIVLKECAVSCSLCNSYYESGWFYLWIWSQFLFCSRTHALCKYCSLP